MRKLRGVFHYKNLMFLFVVAFVTASSLTLLNPRPTHAEGFLLGTVRCLVRTVLAAECQPVRTTPSQTTTPTAPAPAPQQPAQQSTQPVPQSSTAQMNGTTTPSGSTAAPLPQVEPISVDLPATVDPVPTIDPVTTTSAASRVQQSDYITYFNKHSPYAVLGAQQQAESTAPLVQTSEGWRLLGISWYWWGIVVGIASLLLPSVRQFIFRNFSVLLNK